jgi:hypothetical protein
MTRPAAPPPAGGSGKELVHDVLEVFEGRIMDEPDGKSG